MKRPAFQFYPADWRGNAKLRRCSESARGAWMDVLCVLHDSDEYGVCRWPLEDLARSAGVPLKLLKELSAKDVLKGSDKDADAYVFTPRHAGKDGDAVTLIEASANPCWYCSRFVRDEYVRQRRGASTRFDGINQPPNQQPMGTPKHPIGGRQGDGASSSSSSSEEQKQKKEPSPVGDPPGKPARKCTFAAWIAGLPAGTQAIPPENQVFEYAAGVGIPDDFLALAWTWFERRYANEAKTYTTRGWPTVFGKAVEGNWGKLWWISPEGCYRLTTVGMQLERATRAEAAA